MRWTRAWFDSGASTIDLYQHHFPSRRISIPSLMGFMADAVAEGKVRAIGVSNYSAEQLRVAHAALAERGIPWPPTRWSTPCCIERRR